MLISFEDGPKNKVSLEIIGKGPIIEVKVQGPATFSLACATDSISSGVV